MEKDSLYPTNKSTNIFFNTGKTTSPNKLDYNHNTLFGPKTSQNSKKFKFYPFSRNFSKLYNSNRNYEIDNLFFNSLINNDSQIKNLKLESLLKRAIYNSERRNYSSENQKDKSGYNNYFRNQTIRSYFSLEDEIENRKNKKKNLIIFILNKKLKTYKVKKIKEINKNSSNLLDSLYGKGMFGKKFERNFMIKSKPLKYCFKNKNKTPKSIDKKSNILSLFYKNDNFSHNKKIFKTIDLGNKKEIFSNQLLNAGNDKNQYNNIDCHSLMKYPVNYNNIITYNNYSSKFSNFSPALKSKLRTIDFKDKVNKRYNFHDLKSLSRKGFDNMKKNRKLEISKQINDTLEEIESNRKKFDLILDSNLKIFNKNKEETLKIKINNIYK